MNCENSLQPGQFVRALAGRDKDNIFIVVGISGDYVYIADGRRRKAESPKLKNVKHLQKYNRICTSVNEILVKGELPENSLIRKEIEGIK